MTTEPAALGARIASVTELGDIVGAIRTIAAARLQQALATLAATQTYADLIGAALASVIGLAPEPERRNGRTPPRGTILFCAEHGFVGALNARLIEVADQHHDGAPALFVIGRRGAATLAEHGRAAAWSLAMASDLGAVTTTARRISEELYRRFSAGALSGVDLVFAHHQGGGPPVIEHQTLLPVDLLRFPRGAATQPPLTNLPPDRLMDRLLEEYLFGQLAHAAMAAFAAENSARLATMEAASRNLDTLLDELRQSERQARQEQITVELLDVVIGTLSPE